MNYYSNRTSEKLVHLQWDAGLLFLRYPLIELKLIQVLL